MKWVYGVLLCFLVSFSVFSALNINVEAQSPSGTITFQENSIPDVSVYYDDYSFVFEYKSFFIRIRPFVIYNGTFYGMKRIVQWIKNNYPNVNYKWLVDKAVNAIHYGFNLTKLPPEVAEKIDYLGFSLVDLNFPLSWFELEKIEIIDVDKPYNITYVHIPKANLIFSFEDLYPYGYSIQHINSTYILIGEVKGKTDLIVDPITFSAPLITVVGETGKGDSWANAYSFWDIWNASNANGWGVAHNNNNTNAQFEFDARIQIGDSVDDTYFLDTAVQVTFSDVINYYRPFYVHHKGYVRFGQLDDDANKVTSNGLSLLSNIDTGGQTQIIYIRGTATVEIYNSYIHNNGSSSSGYGFAYLTGDGSYIIYNSILDGLGFSLSLGASVIAYNLLITDSAYGFVRPQGTFEILNVKHIVRGIQFYSSTSSTFRNCIFANASDYTFWGNAITVAQYLINVEADVWSFLWQSNPTGEVYRQYEFDLNATFANATAIQNANVTLSYYGEGGGTVGSWLTFANGTISTQTLSMGFYNQTGGDTIYDYNPYNLTITLSGYQTYSKNFTLGEKTDWIISLLGDVKTDPVARFEFSPERPYVDETITFDATNSTDPDGGSISTYSWSWGDGEADGSGVTDTHSYSSAGEYSVELTVTDDESATDSTILKVNVTDYASPTARFTFTPSNPEQNEDITFDGTGSTDRDGSISSYSWTFGDGTTATTSTTTKNYEAEGTFTVTLTVTDSQSKTDSTTQSIIVQNPPPPSGGGAGPAPGTTPPPIPIETSNIALLLSWGADSFTYYPYADHNYVMNFTVTNNATEDQAVTVAYWLNNQNNETVWESTHSFLTYASSELVLTLTYPISKDGSYTAYAQVIAPDPDGQIQSSQFTATSGLPLLIVFFIIIVGTILALAIIKVETSKKKGGKVNE